MSANIIMSEKTKYLNKPLGLRLRNSDKKEKINAARYKPKHLEQTRKYSPFMEMHL